MSKKEFEKLLYELYDKFPNVGYAVSCKLDDWDILVWDRPSGEFVAKLDSVKAKNLIKEIETILGKSPVKNAQEI